LGVLAAIGHIVVGNHANRIIGSKETLARAVAGQSARDNFRSVELKWRALRKTQNHASSIACYLLTWNAAAIGAKRLFASPC
jgi:predicted alpha/beta-fold hydrolase